MLSRLRGGLEYLSRAEHDPGRTAAALALGVFLSFSPFLGLQILIGMGAAVALRLSRVAVLIGLCTNLPWIMLPWYALATAAGAMVVEAPASTDIRAALARLFELPLTGPAFWTQALDILAPFLWSFVFGSIAGALLLGVAAYFAVERYLSRVHASRVAALPDAPFEPSA